MKKMFKLAAIAVSIVLAAGLVACSSGDDDVVDASTPKYLVTAQIEQYFASIVYSQNVTKEEKKSLEDAQTVAMELLGNCEDCLGAYLGQLKKYVKGTDATPLNANNITTLRGDSGFFGKLKAGFKTDKEYHRVFVYKPAIEKAVEAVTNAYTNDYDANTVENITDDEIVKGSLNDAQAATMTKYIDAVKALVGALKDDDVNKDKTACKLEIEAAETAIKTFENLKNKNVTATGSIKALTDKVDDLKVAVNKVVVEIAKKDPFVTSTDSDE